MRNRIAESPQFVESQAKLSTVLAGSEGDYCESHAPNGLTHSNMKCLARLQSEFNLNSNWMFGSNEPMFLLEVDFNPRFKEFREKAPGILGITFDEILQKCGISEEDYLAYEQGLKYPPVEHLFSLCRECHLNINWLFGLKSSMFSKKAVDR